MKKIYGADLFCGAGGTSLGLEMACKEKGMTLDLLAINHWHIAIETHFKNNPNVRHLCQSLDNVNPRKLVPSGELDILVASPECTHHSNARGGKPMCEQSRASAWHVLRWAEALNIRNILIENVREFQSWGPLSSNGRPIKRKKGELFKAFITSLRAMNYNVEYRVLNAADYGDPTTRKRLFILARKGRRIIFPRITYTKGGSMTILGKTKKWRSAREIIDWNIEGKSIFERKKPLSPNTMRRIITGLRKFSGKELEPFIVKMYGNSNAGSVEDPVPTITTNPKVGVCKPFLVEYYGNGYSKSVDEPLPTLTTKDRLGIAEPFILRFTQSGGGDGCVQSVDDPLATVMTKQELAVCEPFILPNEGYYGGNQARSIDEPLNTITSRGGGALIKPFIIPNFGERDGQAPRVHDVDDPLPAVTSHGAGALVRPFLLGQQSGATPRSTDDPVPTIATAGAISLIMPEIDGYRLDIKFRMLTPNELARAMSFPKNYEFAGKKVDVVKQIGNAVPVKTAKELCKCLI